MNEFLQHGLAALSAEWRSFVWQLLHPGWGNFFYLLLAVSLAAAALERLRPWRKEQPLAYPGFWLDVFYMFFNMFLFPLLGFAVLSFLFAQSLASSAPGRALQGALPLQSLPAALQLLIVFVLRDFVQWMVHVILHRVGWLWRLHEVHHSAETMGFAVHLRYHWLENVIYRIPETFLMLVLGRSVGDLFVIYSVSLLIGHLNHANVRLPWGPLRYIFNNSEMHLWHHARSLPRNSGVNFAISLSIWDWIFGTLYLPDRPPQSIGLLNRPDFPRTFFGQVIWPLGNRAASAPAGTADGRNS
ncbi:MAG: sterol desaturase family protein [Leptospirales bacterium]|nr:sterol desaturase family protein [Leptospirales bacterium]